MSEENNAGRGRNGRFARTMESAEKSAEVVRLKAAGHSFAVIADRLGYADASGAHRAYSRALAAVPVEAVGELRALESQRLDALLLKLADAIEDGDPKAITEARKISESRRRLHGLDGPTVHVVTTGVPDGLREQVEAAKARILEERGRVAEDGGADV